MTPTESSAGVVSIDFGDDEPDDAAAPGHGASVDADSQDQSATDAEPQSVESEPSDDGTGSTEAEPDASAADAASQHGSDSLPDTDAGTDFTDHSDAAAVEDEDVADGSGNGQKRKAPEPHGYRGSRRDVG